MRKIDAKALFVSAIKELLKRKTLEDITVKQIVEQCGLTRQSFYMHYYDKFDLVNQIYIADVKKSLRSFSNNNTAWYSVCADLLEIMRENQRFYVNAFKYNSQNSLSTCAENESIKVHSVILLPEIKNKASIEKVVNSIKFYSYGSLRTVKDWTLSGMKTPPKELSGDIVDCMPGIMKSIDLSTLRGPYNFAEF